MKVRRHATHDLASASGDIYTKEGNIIVRSGIDMSIVQCGGECARIVGILRANREHLEKTYHIRSIGLFGSCRRGEEHKGSDADILVEFSDVPGFFDFLRLEGHLTEILGRKVDLVEKSALKPCIARRIVKEVIYI